MNKRTMGELLSHSAMSAIERAQGRFMRAPDHGAGAGAGGGDGGDGGAGAGAGAGAGGGDGGAGAGDGGAGAGGGGGEGAGAGAASLLNAGGGGGAGDGGGGDGGGGAAEWLGEFSDKPAGEGKKSNRDWLATKNFADRDAAITAYRDLEQRMLAGDKLVVPKEGDPPEAFDAFHKAIGRPDEPSGYEIAVPEGAELDQGLADRLTAKAHELGVPKGAFEALAAEFNEYGMELISGQADDKIAAKNAGIKELRSTWGDDFDQNIAHSNKAIAALELDMETVTGIEDGIGTVKTMALLAKLGRGMGEDVLLDGGGSGRFSMGKVEAQAELDSMKTGEKAAKIVNGDKDLIARRKTLLQIVSQHEAAENRAAQSS
jgi:hypothetical protein